MDILGTNPVGLALNGPNAPESDSMGRDAFLKLLVTQLQYQNPLSPMKSTEFTAQLAQFSSLEQLNNINENIESLHSYQSSINNLQSVTYIGKAVTASGNSIYLSGGVSDEIRFELEGNTDAVYISIYNSYGQLINVIETGAKNAGMQTVTWDGTDNGGNHMSDGEYSFEVQAVDPNGQPVKTTTYITGVVTGVAFDGGSASLITGNQKIPIDDVVEVNEG